MLSTEIAQLGYFNQLSNHIDIIIMSADFAFTGEASYNKDPMGPARVLIGNWAEDQRVDSDMTTVYAKEALNGTIWSRDPTLKASQMHRTAQSSAFLTRDPAQSAADPAHYATTTHSSYTYQDPPPSRFANMGARRRLLEAGIIETVLLHAEQSKTDSRSCLPGRGGESATGWASTSASTFTAPLRGGAAGAPDSLYATQAGAGAAAEDALDAAERVRAMEFNLHREVRRRACRPSSPLYCALFVASLTCSCARPSIELFLTCYTPTSIRLTLLRPLRSFRLNPLLPRLVCNVTLALPPPHPRSRLRSGRSTRPSSPALRP